MTLELNNNKPNSKKIVELGGLRPPVQPARIDNSIAVFTRDKVELGEPYSPVQPARIDNSVAVVTRVKVELGDKIKDFHKSKSIDYFWHAWGPPRLDLLIFSGESMKDFFESLNKPPTLFKLCLVKLFKYACPSEIHNIINQKFIELPYKIIKIRDYGEIRGRPGYFEEIKNYFHFYSDWFRPKWITN